MLNIKEIALKIANEYDKREIYFPYRDDLANFAEALIAELAKKNEPVGYFEQEYVGGPVLFYQVNYGEKDNPGVIPLFALPPTAEQIANETAEAIAKYFEQSGIGGDCLAEGVRSGAWKEFKK